LQQDLATRTLQQDLATRTLQQDLAKLAISRERRACGRERQPPATRS